MKYLSHLFSLGALALCVAAPCLTAQSSESTDEAIQQTEHKNLVGEALKKLKTFNGKPNTNAKFYIYLQSASWCGPCRAEMPNIVKEYKKIKRAGGEIILLGCDKTLDAAKEYLKKFRAKFPGMMAEMGQSLPGFERAGGIPNAMFVRPDGSVMKNGHGSIIMDWESIVCE